jgi:hypothetical protein
MAGWSFLTKHGRVLLCIADDPGVRLRDIAATLGITERSAYSIVSELTAAGYAVKQKDGRRNRYQIQAHLPLHEPTSQQLAIGEVLALLAGAEAGTSAGLPGLRREPEQPWLFSAVREPSAGPAGDQVVGEQQDGRTGDRGDPGGGVEEPLQGVVVEVEQLGGCPSAEQCAGDADQAGDDEAL